jgi:transaldolase
VASFFVSRVDTLVDKRLQTIIDAGGPQAEAARALLGRAAVANARLAYDDFKQTFATERFARLRAAGACVQRPLWASTGTKNPVYSDVLYVDELIGPNTVNTVPPQTLAALLDHGRAALTLETGLDEARQTLADLEALGIRMDDVTEQLEREGVQAFADAFAELLAGVEARRG